ncbi:sigma-70 family RNA polymerase sigma factor [Alloacidobacterium dinghuense]|uniref:Sigma-70 family RNA polymerase sigma factor n=1 Tax=Alloacidobacterium dinghuense TaxID=2763107 RepID=A0A7G8BJN3_9BACT|nr:sigma-70 family RNA polymerase sigma factor [Alloacidobacterium dinghuense]QNI32753.1 sigma-70 family RNA polymerase sigma factor [Alloacidobacterium dinghuense]
MSTNILADATLQQPQLSDDQLLSQAKSGDHEAFGELCLRYNAMLKHRIFSIVRQQEDTEDVLQDTFLSAYKHLHSFRGKSKFSTWMIRIGINRSLMLLRKRKTLSKTTSEVLTEDAQEIKTPQVRDPKPNPEQRCMISQTQQILGDAVRRLPCHMRSVIDHRYGKNRRIKEAAATLGITETNVKLRLVRARHMLRRSLKKNELWIP